MKINRLKTVLPDLVQPGLQGWPVVQQALPGLRADLDIVKAHRADDKGNLTYQRAARNFNPLVAMAADYVVAETDEIVDAGQIDPELVMTPGILVDALILAEGK